MDKESDSRYDVGGKTMAKWIDYNEMTGSFIYEESSLDFDSLLQRVAAIRELFRKQ